MGDMPTNETDAEATYKTNNERHYKTKTTKRANKSVERDENKRTRKNTYVGQITTNGKDAQAKYKHI